MVKVEMTKEQYEKLKADYQHDKVVQPIKQPTFNSHFKFGKRMDMNKSLKQPDTILIFLLNLRKQIEGPLLVKIYGGNFFVIRNHVYRFNPDKVFSFGKYKAGIAKEYDREMVGIDDYEELVQKDFASKNPGGRVNIDDPVLIKALIAARLSEKPVTTMSMGKWILIGLVIIGVCVGFFMLTGKKAETVTPPTTTP